MANRSQIYYSALRPITDKAPVLPPPPDRPRHTNEGNLPDLAVRDGRWKLLCEYGGAERQLYNLDIDRAKRQTLRCKPAIAERLTAAVVDWNNSMPADKGATYTALGKLNEKARSSKRQRN